MIFIVSNEIYDEYKNKQAVYDRYYRKQIEERLSEYYGAAEPPVRCGESHLSGLTEPPHFIY